METARGTVRGRAWWCFLTIRATVAAFLVEIIRLASFVPASGHILSGSDVDPNSVVPTLVPVICALITSQPAPQKFGIQHKDKDEELVDIEVLGCQWKDLGFVPGFASPLPRVPHTSPHYSRPHSTPHLRVQTPIYAIYVQVTFHQRAIKHSGQNSLRRSLPISRCPFANCEDVFFSIAENYE